MACAQRNIITEGDGIMSEQYFVYTHDLDTDGTIVDGPFPTERAAIAYAEGQAEEFFGGDDVTWYEILGMGEYHVGRLMTDGSRSEPKIKITVVEEEVEIEEDPTLSDSDAKGEESSPASPIIPGNVGSLADVPSDLMEGEVPTVDDEKT